MNGLDSGGKSSKILTLVGVIIIAGALHIAREIFIPVAVATLLSFLLAPLAKRLTRWRFPNVVAVLATVGFAFTILGIVGWLVSAQLVNLADELPDYQDNIRAKIASVSGPRDGSFSRALDMIGVLRRQIEEQAAEAVREESADFRDPVLVEVQEEPPNPVELLTQYGGPLLTPIGMAGVTLVFVIFILLQRNDLRDRLIKLVSGGNLNLATQAVDDATRRITRYLLMQLVINATYGIPLGIGLYFIGVPNALLWGMLAILLRFLPFVGPWIAAFFPISLSIAVDPGWTMPLMVIGLVIILELISNNIVEPWLYGSSTGISIVALLFAALVWTWIWGPIGLFLSTPLTVCLLVIGKNVPSLGFLNVILGSEPVLPPEARLYQRMLGMDAEAMIDLADDHLEKGTLVEFYDRTLVPALTLAEQDRHAGNLAERRQQFIIRSTRDLLEELGERLAKTDSAVPEKPVVLCVPAQDEADELTTLMFAQVLRQAGIRAETGGLADSAGDVVRRAEELRANIICLCAIPPAAVSGVRKKCRRLRDRGTEATLIAGIWDPGQSATAVERRLASVCPDLVATTFTDALAQVANLLETFPGPEDPVPLPRAADRNQALLRRLGFHETRPEELYDKIQRELAKRFEVPISLVMIAGADRHFWKPFPGIPVDLTESADELGAVSLHASAASNELIVVEDLSKDERFAGNPLVNERGIRFCAAAPMRTASGHVVGSLCVINTNPQQVTGDQKRLLETLADRLVQAVEESPKSRRDIDTAA